MRDKTVLLIDDEKPVLDSLGNYLEKNKYEVSTALSGEAGLAAYKTNPTDMVITDLVMDGINGIEVLERDQKIQ